MNVPQMLPKMDPQKDMYDEDIPFVSWFDFVESLRKREPGIIIVHTYIQDDSTASPVPEAEDYEFPTNDRHIRSARHLEGFMGKLIRPNNTIDMFIYFRWPEDRDAWLEGKKRNQRYVRW